MLFIGFGLITTLPLEKGYPLLAKTVAVFLFVVLCLVIPALLSMRPRQEIAAGNASWASGDDPRLKTPTLTFADVGGLEESKKQIRKICPRRTSMVRRSESTVSFGMASFSTAREERERRS